MPVLASFFLLVLYIHFQNNLPRIIQALSVIALSSVISMYNTLCRVMATPTTFAELKRVLLYRVFLKRFYDVIILNLVYAKRHADPKDSKHRCHCGTIHEPVRIEGE